jgi:hypothetical protein
VQTLLALGADVNAASADDSATPMHMACFGRGEALADVLRLLLDAGGDKELRDALGRRPVDLLLSQVRLGLVLNKPILRAPDAGAAWLRCWPSKLGRDFLGEAWIFFGLFLAGGRANRCSAQTINVRSTV